jgi:hypothetical protein
VEDTRKEAFTVLFQHLPKVTKEKHEILESGG